MRKFKWIYENKSLGYTQDITYGKVYDLLEYLTYYEYVQYNDPTEDSIFIVNDEGIYRTYNLYDFDNNPIFIEVTLEYRNEVLDEILE